MTFWTLLLTCALAQDARTVDAFEGTVVGNSRMMGIGGAYTALAEGASAHFTNPAAFAVRRPDAPTPWHIDASLQLVGIRPLDRDPFRPADLGGIRPVTRFQGGLNLKLPRTGVGLYALRQGYSFVIPDDVEGSFARMQHGLLGLGAGRVLADGQLVVGLLGMLGYATITQGPNSIFGRPVLSKRVGFGASVGLVWDPDDAPLRFGLMARPALRVALGDAVVAGLGPVRFPAEVGVGVAWTIAGKPSESRYLLAALDVLTTGGSADAVSLSDTPEPGSEVVSVRLGMEAEPLRDRLRLRLGTYNQPGRYDSVDGQQHLTGGFELNTFAWPKTFPWRLGLAADGSREAFRWTVAVGRW